jgi:hypothetical protein
MPLGALLDQWEVHLQFQGVKQPARERYVDDVLPKGL